MSPKRTYFPPTTPQQRKLLFETWQATGSVAEACQKAHVGRGTFYLWKPRFDVEGYAGLISYRKKGPEKGYGRIAKEVEQKIVEIHKEHENWGKHRIANEITKSNNWVALVSPNTVRRVLEEAGMWHTEEPGRKKAPSQR